MNRNISTDTSRTGDTTSTTLHTYAKPDTRTLPITFFTYIDGTINMLQFFEISQGKNAFFSKNTGFHKHKNMLDGMEVTVFATSHNNRGSKATAKQ